VYCTVQSSSSRAPFRFCGNPKNCTKMNIIKPAVAHTIFNVYSQTRARRYTRDLAGLPDPRNRDQGDKRSSTGGAARVSAVHMQDMLRVHKTIALVISSHGLIVPSPQHVRRGRCHHHHCRLPSANQERPDPHAATTQIDHPALPLTVK
jgi:hypothetical protein